MKKYSSTRWSIAKFSILKVFRYSSINKSVICLFADYKTALQNFTIGTSNAEWWPMVSKFRDSVGLFWQLKASSKLQRRTNEWKIKMPLSLSLSLSILWTSGGPEWEWETDRAMNNVLPSVTPRRNAHHLEKPVINRALFCWAVYRVVQRLLGSKCILGCPTKNS